MAAVIGTTRLSTKGQGIVPKNVRDYMGAKDNTAFVVMALDKDTMVWKKLEKTRIVEEFRNIRKSIKNRLTEDEINDIIHKAK